MAKRAHVAGIFVSCMSSVPRAFVRTPNSRAAPTIHAKLFTFTRVKRVHTRVHTHACVKFKVSGTVLHRRRDTPPDRLVLSILMPRKFSSPATTWGIENESKAIQAYVEHKKSCSILCGHVDF